MTHIAVIGAGSWGTAVAAIAAGNAPTTLWAAPRRARDPDRPAPREQQLPAGRAFARSLARHRFDRSRVHRRRRGRARGARRTACARGPRGREAVHRSPGAGRESGQRHRTGNARAHDRSRMRCALEHDRRVHRRADGSRTWRARSRRASRPPRWSRLPTRQSPSSLQQLFFSPSFRVYTNPDVVGCEMAGALKNVLAIGAGIADGLGYGDNTKAALITRGLSELARLGVALGGDPLTFAGLAGMGDLIATCSSPQSRNRHVGVELGTRSTARRDRERDEHGRRRGEDARRRSSNSPARHEVEMPLASFVGRVLYEGARPADLVPELMQRKAKPEMQGMR